tara:strand:- start:111 stop:773 length:663 start_codon:yes stop_codon:yes gene_type:complete
MKNLPRYFVVLFLIFITLPVSSEINDKDELREFLIKNDMKYISTDGYIRIFSFNENDTGTYYMDNIKKEMPLIWEVVNKNTLRSGHPKIVEQKGWTILKIDFEKKKLYQDLSSINGEKYIFDVMFERSNLSNNKNQFDELQKELTDAAYNAALCVKGSQSYKTGLKKRHELLANDARNYLNNKDLNGIRDSIRQFNEISTLGFTASGNTDQYCRVGSTIK